MVEAMPAADKALMSPDWLSRLRAATAADVWSHGFNLRLRGEETVIGHAGFTKPPEADGVVELAYGIAAEHQGKGFATEAAEALVAFAFSSGLVRVVRAHTLPEPNASTRVLTKCGFEWLGEVNDPEDGLIWRWERRAKSLSACQAG